MIVQEWQLIAALAGVAIAGLSLLFALWKFVDHKIREGDKALHDQVQRDRQEHDKQMQLLHDRISKVNDNTPSHDDIRRVEGYLERISSRIDQLVAMVMQYSDGRGKGDR